MAGTSISFNSNSLQTNKIITQDIQHASIPTKDAKLYALAHASASAIPFTSYPSKTITITGRIFDDTVELLDATLDVFRGYFTVDNANLDIGYNNSIRRYIATMNVLDITRPGGLTYADFSLELICTQPFGQDITATTAIHAIGRTAASYTDLITMAGTAPWQKPVVTLTYSAVVGSGAINFSNNANGQQITISGTRSAGDIVIFDSFNKRVQVNYVDYTFTGAFPEFPPGAASMQYSDGLTSRTFTYDIQYYPMYL
jgi:hypothetical protein